MVKSKTYKGTAHSGEHETPGAHEAIVSGDIWNRANRPMPGPSPDPDREPRPLERHPVLRFVRLPDAPDD
jgi:hypothetical protein